MFKRYLHVFRRHVIFIILIIAFIIISSVTKGKTATVTSVIAGIIMIYVAISFTIWIIRTPSTKDEDSDQ